MLGAGLALFVATTGFSLETGVSHGTRLGLSFGYGSIVGFAASALLVGLAFATGRVPALDWSRAPMVLPATALSAAYVAVVVLPWWGVLPSGVWSVFAIGLTRLSWLTIAAAAVGIRLARLWVRRLADSSSATGELVVLPLALLALALIDAVRLGAAHATWNTALLGGLAVALIGCGHVERAGGAMGIEIPEILRIDRI